MSNSMSIRSEVRSSEKAVPQKPHSLLHHRRSWQGNACNDEQSSSSSGLTTLATSEDAGVSLESIYDRPQRRKSAEIEQLRPKPLARFGRQTIGGDCANTPNLGQRVEYRQAAIPEGEDDDLEQARVTLKTRLHLDLTSIRESTASSATASSVPYPPPLPPSESVHARRQLPISTDPRSSVVTEPTPIPIPQFKFQTRDSELSRDSLAGKRTETRLKLLGELDEEPTSGAAHSIGKRKSLSGLHKQVLDDELVQAVRSTYVCVSGISKPDLYLLVHQLDQLQFVVQDTIGTRTSKHFVKLQGGQSERNRLLRRKCLAIFDSKGTLVHTAQITDPASDPSLCALLQDCPRGGERCANTYLHAGGRDLPILSRSFTPQWSSHQAMVRSESATRCVGFWMLIVMKLRHLLLMLMGLVHWGEGLFLPSPFDDDFSPRRGAGSSNPEFVID